MSNFHDKVVYQVYPKSFKDSNGDGIGDLRGVIEKLAYLADLGVDMLWLNPFFTSPQNDNGYDISNYKEIDPLFGTMADFEELVHKAEALGMEIMLDMVLNHSSTEHEWFQKALAGDKEYQDYYYLRPAQENGDLPTNWESKFGGPSWSKFGQTDLYYMHLFDPTQADLNWHNPKVREELHQVVNFWLNKGVKGFRFDVINLIGKSTTELVDDLTGNGKPLYTDQPIVHDYLKEMNQATFGRVADTVTVGEMSSTTIENCVLYSNPTREELSMAFSFHHLKVDYVDGEKWSLMPFDFLALKNILNDWQTGMSEGDGWNALFWNNHDQPRAISRFADPVNYHSESATLLAQTIHLLRGTPYIYQGEELGMTNPDYEAIEDFMDIETHNAYRKLQEKGLSESEAMAIIREKSRDNNRTPMQWTDEEHAGFTTGTPWLKVVDNYREINVAKEVAKGSIFSYYQRLIQLRKELPIIANGSYEGLLLEHPSVYAYARHLNGETVLVFNHFYAEPVTIQVPEEYLNRSSRYLIGNGQERELTSSLTLAPYETIAFYLDA